MNENSTLEKITAGLKWFAKSYIWVMILLLGLDILSKQLTQHYLWNGPYETGYSDCVTVIPNFFYIRVLFNTGAAWGSFDGNRIFLISISLIAAILFIFYLVWKWKKLAVIYRAALYLMIPGCIGNLIDRAFYRQGVIDFLEFHFCSYIFPTFNFADAFLVCGVIVLLIGLLYEDYIKPKREIKKVNQSKSGNSQDEEDSSQE